MSDDHFLARWSRRKLASTAGPERPTAHAIPVPTGIQSTASAAAVVPAQAGTQSPATAAAVVPAQAGTQSPASAAAVIPAQAGTQSPQPLPPVESLTPESDYTPFMKAEVDPELRRKALKALFQDPRFNLMDGMDVYIDDYSKPDPLPEGWLEKMNQFSHLGDRAQRDREEAAAAAAAAVPPQIAEKAAQEQTLAEAPLPLPSDTSDAVSPPSELKES